MDELGCYTFFMHQTWIKPITHRKISIKKSLLAVRNNHSLH